MRTVLAVDPGSRKCGFAVVADGDVLHKGIVSRDEMPSIVASEISRTPVEVILVGNGTGGRDFVRELRAAGISMPIDLVDEAFSTLEARKRYFREHPPKGLRRLIPIGLLSPDHPYDDYVAVILAERYLSTSDTENSRRV